MNEKITLEVAEQEFESFCEAMIIYSDVDTMDADAAKAFTDNKRKVVQAIQRGDLTFNEQSEPVLTPTRSDLEPITFHEPAGPDYMAMDRKKKDHDVTKMYALMSSMAKKSTGYMAKLKGVDAKVAQAIAALFLD